MVLTQRQRQIIARAPANRRAAITRGFREQQIANSAVVNRRNTRIPVRRRPNNLPTRYVTNDPRGINVGNTYPPNSMTIPNNPSYHQQASNLMAIQHITLSMQQAPANRQQSQTFAMRPSRQGYNALAQMFGEFRYVNLQMRFISTAPATTDLTYAIGYTTSTQIQLANNISNLSSLRGFSFGNAARSTGWTTIISPPDSTTVFLQNSANNVGADHTNSQGFIHYVVMGGAEGNIAGNIEIRGQVQFRAPI